MKPVFLAAVGISLSFLCAGPVLAARSDITVSRLQVQLIDLDTSDGVVPALTFSEGSTSLSYLRSDLSHYAEGSKSEPSLNSAIGPLFADDGHGSLSAQSFGGSLVSAQGWSGQVWISNLGGPIEAIASITVAGQFTLTPHTLMLVSGDVKTPQFYAANGDVATAESVLRIADTDDSTEGNSRTYLSLDHGVRTHLGSDHLQASFANLAGTTVDGSFLLRLTASAINNDFVSEVPEPQVGALLLAGLVFLGGQRCRRARRAVARCGVMQSLNHIASQPSRSSGP